jgi:hypothetical protein
MASLKHNMDGDLSNTQLPSWYPKYACKNLPLFLLEFLSSPMLSCLTLFPRMIVIQPHDPNDYGMWLLTPIVLHEFNDWVSNKSKGGLLRKYINLGKEMGFPLGYLFSHLSCGIIAPQSLMFLSYRSQ